MNTGRRNWEFFDNKDFYENNDYFFLELCEIPSEKYCTEMISQKKTSHFYENFLVYSRVGGFEHVIEIIGKIFLRKFLKKLVDILIKKMQGWKIPIFLFRNFIYP